MNFFSSSNIIKQIVGDGGFGAVGQVASFLGVVAYTQLVSQSVLGSYFLFVAILQIITSLGNKGVSVDLTRRISRSETPGEELTTAGAFTLGVTGFLIVLVIIIGPILSTYIGGGFGHWLPILLPITIFELFTRSVLQGEQKNTRAAALVAIKRVGTYTVGSGAILSGLEPTTGLIGGLLFANLLVISGGVLMIRVTPKGYPMPENLFRLARRAATLTVADLGDLGQEWIDTVLIGVFLTPSAVALYEVAWRLSAVSLLVSNPVASVLYPRFAELARAQNHDKIRVYLQKAFFYVLTPMIALFVGAVALGAELVTVLYGATYAGSYTPLLVLLVGRVSYTFVKMTTVVGYCYGRDRGVASANVAAALINAITNATLIPLVGIVGAAMGSLLSFTVLAFILSQLMADHMRYPPVIQFVPVLVAAGAMLVVVRLVASRLPGTILSLLGLVALGGVLFSVILIQVSPQVKSDVKTLVDTIQ